MSMQLQSNFNGFPAPISNDTTFQTANVTGSVFVSSEGTATFLKTSVGSLVGFFGVTPVARQTTAVSGVTVAGTNASGTIVTSTTFGGYTIAQIASSLINIGILSTV